MQYKEYYRICRQGYLNPASHSDAVKLFLAKIKQPVNKLEEGDGDAGRSRENT